MSTKPCTCNPSSTSDQASRTSPRVSGPTVVNSSSPPSRSTLAASRNTSPGIAPRQQQVGKDQVDAAVPQRQAFGIAGDNRSPFKVPASRPRPGGHVPAQVHGENPRVGILYCQFRHCLARGGAQIDDSPGVQFEQRQPCEQPCARFGVNSIGIVEGGAGPPQPHQRGGAVRQSERVLHRRPVSRLRGGGLAPRRCCFRSQWAHHCPQDAPCQGRACGH